MEVKDATIQIKVQKMNIHKYFAQIQKKLKFVNWYFIDAE